MQYTPIPGLGLGLTIRLGLGLGRGGEGAVVQEKDGQLGSENSGFQCPDHAHHANGHIAAPSANQLGGWFAVPDYRSDCLHRLSTDGGERCFFRRGWDCYPSAHRGCFHALRWGLKNCIIARLS